MSKGLPANKILTDAGITPQKLNTVINDMRKGRVASSASAEDSFQALKKYTKDFTELAKQGKLDPVIGRDEEIRRTMQVLSRRTISIPARSAKLVSVKPPLSKGWRSASSAATCRRRSRINACYRSIWR